MGDLVADAQAQATGADAAFVNPGEIRSGLAAGDVTFGRAFAALPFGNSLVSMTLTGAELHELLKQQWCGRTRPRVLQPSAGVRYGWSAATAAAIEGLPCATAPNPVSDLQIAGTPVGAEQTYRVTVSSMLAGGFNDFAALQAGDGASRRPGGRPPRSRPIWRLRWAANRWRRRPTDRIALAP